MPHVLFKCVYPPMMTLVHQLSDVDRAHIDLCGLPHLLDLPDIRVNHGMLTALVERFHSEHNTFHFPLGEMTINPEDVYRILCIPFVGDKVDYDAAQLSRLLAVRHVFKDLDILTRSISRDVMMSKYSEDFPLACILASFIGCFLMPDRGQQGFFFGWGRMLERLIETPQRLGWGSCILAHMYSEMHEIAYREGKSMDAGVLILQVWAWEHLPVCRSIVDDDKDLGQPIVYRY